MVTVELLEDKVKHLKYKVNTTPWFLGKFIYVSMLANTNDKLSDLKRTLSRKPLNLCYEHSQGDGFSCYSYHNCDYCKAIEDGNIETNKRIVPQGQLYVRVSQRS